MFQLFLFSAIPSQVKFELGPRDSGCSTVTWFENKIYVVAAGVTKIRAFSDKAPFTELPEDAIDLPHPLDFSLCHGCQYI